MLDNVQVIEPLSPPMDRSNPEVLFKLKTEMSKIHRSFFRDDLLQLATLDMLVAWSPRNVPLFRTSRMRLKEMLGMNS